MKSLCRNKFQAIAVLSALMLSSVSAGRAYAAPESAREFKRSLTAEFVEADVRDVIRTLARLAGINIIISDRVQGRISISLTDVCFSEALRAVVDIKGLGYEETDGIMRIAPIAVINERREAVDAAAPLEIKVFSLKYTNARKLETVISGFLSDRGSLSIYHRSVRGGWPVVGISEDRRSIGPASRDKIAEAEFPTIMVVRDSALRIKAISEIIETLDRKPKQVLIEALIAEVRYDDKRDIGINWETLTGEGAEGEGHFVITGGREGGLDLGTFSETLPAPEHSGLGVTYTKLTGMKLRAVIRALELEGRATVLSSPRTLVLDGHEATVLVGLKHPIFEATLIGETERISESLSHYEPVGVLLRVVPAVWEDNLVNLSVHPAVTALGSEVVGTTGIKAREIITQEVDTNITIRSGETVVIGGLIRDGKESKHYGVPFLSHIPILGFFFRREVVVDERQELVIFITPTVVEDPVLSLEERTEFEAHAKELGSTR